MLVSAAFAALRKTLGWIFPKALGTYLVDPSLARRNVKSGSDLRDPFQGRSFSAFLPGNHQRLPLAWCSILTMPCLSRMSAAFSSRRSLERGGQDTNWHLVAARRADKLRPPRPRIEHGDALDRIMQAGTERREIIAKQLADVATPDAASCDCGAMTLRWTCLTKVTRSVVADFPLPDDAPFRVVKVLVPTLEELSMHGIRVLRSAPCGSI